MEPKIDDDHVKQMLQLAGRTEYADRFFGIAIPYLVQTLTPEIRELRPISKFITTNTGIFSDRDGIIFNLMKTIQENHEGFQKIEPLREIGFEGVREMRAIDPELQERSIPKLLDYAKEKYNSTLIDILLDEFGRLNPDSDKQREYFSQFAFGNFGDTIVAAFHMKMAREQGYNVTVLTGEEKDIANYILKLIRDDEKGKTELEQNIEYLKKHAQEEAKAALDRGEDMENPPEGPITSIPEKPIKKYNMLAAVARMLDEGRKKARGWELLKRECYPLIKCMKPPAPHFVARLITTNRDGPFTFMDAPLGIFREEGAFVLRHDLFERFIYDGIGSIVDGTISAEYMKTCGAPDLG